MSALSSDAAELVTVKLWPRLGRLETGRVLFMAFVALILFFLILPTIMVILMSFASTSYIQFPPKTLSLKWYRAYFSDPEWLAATWFSVKIAMTTTLAATCVGTLAAIALERSRVPGASFLRALTLGPLIVPHVVIAISLYLVFAPIGLTGNFIGFVLAHTMLAVPYVLITVSAALRGFDPLIERAALSCGATRIKAFFDVVLPSIWPGVASGAVFAFLASFDEATVALFISGVDGKPLTRKFFEDIDFNLTPVIAAVSTLMTLVSLVMMGSIKVAQARSRS